MFGINNNSSPEPDGFNNGFYKGAWRVVGKDVTEAILEFFQKWFGTYGDVSRNVSLTNTFATKLGLSVQSAETKLEPVGRFIAILSSLQTWDGIAFLLDRLEGAYALMLYLLMSAQFLPEFYHHYTLVPEFLVHRRGSLQFTAGLVVLLFIMMDTEIWDMKARTRRNQMIRPGNQNPTTKMNSLVLTREPYHNNNREPEPKNNSREPKLNNTTSREPEPKLNNATSRESEPKPSKEPELNNATSRESEPKPSKEPEPNNREPKLNNTTSREPKPKPNNITTKETEPDGEPKPSREP